MRDRDVSRLILDLRKHDIDVFDEFGRYNYVKAQTTLPSHIHPDMIEICYLAKGSQEYFVNNETFTLYGGDIFITFPNEIHGTGNAPEEKGILYWMVLKRPKQECEYLGLSYSEAHKLFFRLQQLPKRLFKAGSECECILQKITQIYFQKKESLTAMRLNNLLVSFLLHIIQEGEKSLSRTCGERITEIIRYINGNIFETLDLDFLANKCNLSLSRFKHLFKEETGIPPSEYIIRKKIEKAQEMMDENKHSIKDIAYDLGFSSPAYFSTVFKQYNGYSPTSYKIQTKQLDAEN